MQSPTLSTHSSLSCPNERVNENFICFNCNECIPIEDYLIHMSEFSSNGIKKHISESSCFLVTKFTLEKELTNDLSISNSNSITMSSNKLTNTSSFDLDNSLSYLDEETFLLTKLIEINDQQKPKECIMKFKSTSKKVKKVKHKLHTITLDEMSNTKKFF